MSDPQLLQYIKSELDQNSPRDIIEIKLRHIGWPDNLIQEAFQELNSSGNIQSSATNIHLSPGTKKNRTPVLALVLLVFFILLGSGAAYAYFFIVNSPENHIKKMLEGQSKITSYEFEGNFSFTTEGNKPVSDLKNNSSFFESLQLIDPTQAATGKQGFTLNARGKVDAVDKNNPKSALAVSGKLSSDDSSLGVKEISAAGQIVFINKKLFFKIVQFPAALDPYGQSTAVVNKWIIFPPDYLGLGSAKSTNDVISPFTIGGQSLNLEASFSASIKKNQKQIEQIYAKNRFLIIKNNPDEKISNVDTKHYSIKIDPIKLKAFVKDMLPVLKSIASDLGENSDQVVWDDKADKDFEEINKAVRDLDINLWIGKSDNNIYKFVASDRIINPATSEKVNFSSTATFKDYNRPMNITEPEGALTVEQLTEQLMQSESPRTDLLKKSRDSTRLSDLVMLRKAIDASLAESKSKKLPICSGGLLTSKCTTLLIPETNLRSATGKGWIPFDISSYMSTLPTDPKNGEEIINSTGNKVKFAYYFRSNGTDYKIATYLEDPSNQTKAEMDGGSLPDMFEVGTDLTSKLGL